MSRSVATLAGAIVMIVMLTLFFAVRVASRYAPPPPDRRVTGPGDTCARDGDCWCAGFDGAEFIAGAFVQSTCEKGKCALCLYE